jgi:sporulation protein YlmC with PRC-barrel domain
LFQKFETFLVSHWGFLNELANRRSYPTTALDAIPFRLVGRPNTHGTIPHLASFTPHTPKRTHSMADHEPEHVETSSLIASDMVEGTSVFNKDGEKMGTILNFMVNKHSGQVEYAVMSFGGFLGMGEDHYPLPWNKLKYDVAQHGYVVDITREKLDKAPKHESTAYPIYDPVYGTMVNSYYGASR